MLIAALPLVAFVACAHDKLAQRSEDKELADLSSRTELFWRAIKWQDASAAAAFIEGDSARRMWSIEAERFGQETRVTDAALVNMELGELIAEPTDGYTRAATVLVRTEGYALPAQIVKRETVAQTWIRTEEGWYFDWKDGHPLTGQPW